MKNRYCMVNMIIYLKIRTHINKIYNSDENTEEF